MIEDMNLSKSVRLEAAIPDVSEAYTEANLFVIPSSWEGFSNALAESMSHGLPAVGFEKAAGVADLIGKDGWLAKGLNSVQSLAEALGEAMSDHNERARRGNTAAKKMVQFSPDIQFNRWDLLFNSLVKIS
jgi:glycosyltransferase involved in cell wall biosynthesis